MNLSYAQAVIPPNSTITANNSISYTGATSHYTQSSRQYVCTDNQKTTTSPTVRLDNGNAMTATQSVKIPLSTQLSKSATHGHVLDHLKNGSLISIGQLSNDDCAAIITKYHVQIIKNSHIIIKGTRNNTDGLWNIPITPKPSTTPSGNHTQKHTVCSAINRSQTKSELTAFVHGTSFSPITSNLFCAIKQGHFTTWPGLTTKLISKHFPKSLATSKGHLPGHQNNINSIKATNFSSIPLATSLDISPSQEYTNPHTQ